MKRLFLAAIMAGSACSPSTAPEAPADAAPLSGKTLDGKTVSLADYQGKVVLVDFWATWCDPCKDEIPELIKLQNELGPRGFVVLGVSMDEDVKDVAPFAQAAKINYPVILNGGEQAPKGWIVPGLPTAYLIGKDGKTIKRLFGSKSMTILKFSIEAALK